MAINLMNHVDSKTYLVRNREDTLFRAPSLIEEAIFLGDRVLVVFRMIDALENIPSIDFVPTDNDLELAGRNVVMVHQTDGVIWRIRKSIPLSGIGTDFGYSGVLQENGKWIALCQDRYAYELDIETGHTSKPKKWC